MKKRNFLIAIGTFIVLTVTYLASVVFIEQESDTSSKNVETIQSILQSKTSNK